MLDWTRSADQLWESTDGHFRYRVAGLPSGSFIGEVHRLSRHEQVFSDVYIDVEAARHDLERRGRQQYFVKPTDPVTGPPEMIPVDVPVVAVDEVAIEPEPEPSPEEQPPTSSTGTMTGHVIETYRDRNGEWRWRRRAANHKIIADSGEGYKHRRDMLHGLLLANQDVNYVIREITEENQ